jgi:hypothetical protein
VVDSEMNQYVNTISDINEHLTTLSKYASECEFVLVMGVRNPASSWAFTHGLLRNKKNNKILFLNETHESDVYDIAYKTNSLPIVIEYKFIDNLKLELKEQVDLTFIDTWHVYGKMKRELAKFAPFTKKYIIMHDTTVDEWYGETRRCGLDATQQSLESGIPVEEIMKGIWPAIQEFLDVNPEWVLHERFMFNNGLTILRRL